MRIVLALCAVAAMAATAEAKLTPNVQIPFTPAQHPGALEQWSVFLGPAGAMLESDYFRSPRGPFTGRRDTPCRLQNRSASDAVQLAYSCR